MSAVHVGKLIMVTFIAQNARNGISRLEIPIFLRRSMEGLRIATVGIFAESALGRNFYTKIIQNDFYKINGIYHLFQELTRLIMNESAVIKHLICRYKHLYKISQLFCYRYIRFNTICFSLKFIQAMLRYGSWLNNCQPRSVYYLCS